MKLPHTDEIPDHLFEAMRVSRFMAEDSIGRWKLIHFTVTEEDFRSKHLKLAFSGQREEMVEMEMTRMVPPGDYITLSRRMIESEVDDIWFDNFGKYPHEFDPEFVARTLPDSSRWIPVMSDTPAETVEHYPALNGARGAVLITGLGLGCLPHALLTMPEVTRIDIIEIDQDVIALTGHYLTSDPRVSIFHGSATDLSGMPADRTWDYAWHDIWTHISHKNLVDETAEHRISYQRLFDLWAPRVRGEQDAWAYPQAIEMERVMADELREEREFREHLSSLPHEERVHILYNSILRSRVKGIDSIPDDMWPKVVEMLDPEGSFLRHVDKVVKDPEFLAKLDGEPVVDEDRNRLGMPNAELEVTP